ncbi:undecaprenyl-diphosphate phosphatase [Henriciella sp.]|jgi:undecaprenyl-diphosphatase|uniref:undecaprenyl-diphosphate phosphatase n=1 Tax=Henriciella sp. TaxID=1968823 RepID=UPI000C0D4CD8|nr:undecaprenyl-diphosphate phosphatase [Henriciella sp.]PHR76317.1 MAG: UDP-diphosphatase [Henriciella sp.]|tara:strand:+ start:568 stop:1404 length:837 start_codon:yes stop_codon:yes gene_type:complete
MSLLQLVIISIVQGISEWLPISSSAHVLLTANLFGISGEDELMVNAMAHLGTLFALFAYFWRDTARVITGSFELVGIGRENGRLSQGGKLALLILVATPPALVAGLVYELAPGLDVLRTPHVIAAATIVFGLLLWWADVKGPRHRTEADMKLRDGILIGLAQALAFIPGVSRSGVTMTAARALGLSRTEAARFGMLCGAPVLLIAGAYACLKLATAESGEVTVPLSDGLIVAGLSFVTAYASIFALMALLNRMSFLPFVIYRLILGVAIIAMIPMMAG